MTSTNERYANDPASWDWVDPEVLETKSTIKRLNNNTLTPNNLLLPNIDPKTISFVPCTKFDSVCLSRVDGAGEEFFYVYNALFTELRLRLPFSDFQVAILNEINAAPTQLHPNGWIFVRSFELLCQSRDLIPTVPTFFYFFQSMVKGKGWVHVHARQARHKILVLDQRSYYFKTQFFRVEGSEGSVPFFMDENGKPKFPLHWCKSVRTPDPPAFRRLSDCEQNLVTKLQQLEVPSSCAALISPKGKPPRKRFGESESEEEEADLIDDDESEEEEAEVSASVEMKTKRKRVFTRGAAEQMKKRKVSEGNGAPPRREQNIVDVEVEMEHLRGFEGEGRIASLWDRRFDFGRHVRHHLFHSSDKDKLRRTGHVDVGRFVKANALRIAASGEFLVEEVEASRKEVSRLAKELGKEKSARTKAEGQLEEEKVGREKAERELGKCFARARKESDYTEGFLVRELKKSVTESFQNAIAQVRLGFPHLNLDSIALDPFKVVEGEQLVVDPPSARR